MENSNIKKQAKSDIFKELHPIISFYIKKGAKPASLKKYYKNNKIFKDILDDIKNKGINLVKDETEYKSLVREILNDILDDFIAKDKDIEYKNKQESKMKHIKEFNSYNESLQDTLSFISNAGIGITLGLLVRKLYKDIKHKIYLMKLHKKLINMTDEELKNRKNELNLEQLSFYVKDFFKDNKEIKIAENIINYIFELGDMIIKINKQEGTIKWTYIKLGEDYKYYIPDTNNFTEPIRISDEDIQELKNALEQDKKEFNK